MTEEVQETIYLHDREPSLAGAVWYCLKAVLMGIGLGWLITRVALWIRPA